ncbi:MAG: hypothetical protein R2710_15125 [Acidimicrobiales bacterium]
MILLARVEPDEDIVAVAPVELAIATVARPNDAVVPGVPVAGPGIGSEVDGVVAVAPVDRVPAGAAIDDVVAAEGRDRVVAVTGADDVGTLGPDQHVVPTGARDRAASGIGARRQHEQAQTSGGGKEQMAEVHATEGTDRTSGRPESISRWAVGRTPWRCSLDRRQSRSTEPDTRGKPEDPCRRHAN